jgi:hypothetical protein
VQVIAARKGERPALTRTARGKHHALTACGNAAGQMMDPFFTFAGVRENRRFTKGASKSVFCLTASGWPDRASWYKFCKEFVSFKASLGLTKALLIVDGADTHYSLEAIHLLRGANVRLFTLPPACTAKMQPLDVGFFGALSTRVTTLIDENSGVCATADIAAFVTRAYKEFDAQAVLTGKHAITNAFRKSGLYPCNIGVFEDKDFAKSDARLGLSASHPSVHKAKAMTASQIAIVLDSILCSSNIGVQKDLEGHINSNGFDLSMVGLTDDKVVQHLIAEEKAKKDKEGAKAARKAARAAAKTLREAKKGENTVGTKRSRKNMTTSSDSTVHNPEQHAAKRSRKEYLPRKSLKRTVEAAEFPAVDE